MDKDDAVSAMVTMEWTMKNLFFQRWAFPYEESALLYQQLDRLEEARDTARLALKQPWWTVEDLSQCAPFPRRPWGTVCVSWLLDQHAAAAPGRRSRHKTQAPALGAGCGS